VDGTNIVSGSRVADGLQTVTLTYRDALGNAAASVASFNVLVDTTAPVIHVPADVIDARAEGLEGAIVEFDVSAIDVADPSPAVMATPPSGSTFPLGTSSVRVLATDSLGNRSEASFRVVVRLVDPLHADVQVAGRSVPAAGSDPRIPRGAVWAGFGVPCLSDVGHVAYVGRWTSSEGPGAGVFVGDTLVVAGGEAVPSLPGATFRAFKDPLVNEHGGIAAITGNGVTRANDTVVLSTLRGGSLEILAREGGPAAGTDSVYKRFTSVSVQEEEVAWLGTLARSVTFPSVNASSDTGLWSSGSTGTTLRVRKGQTVGTQTIRSFSAFQTIAGSAANGRTHVGAGAFSIPVVYAEGGSDS
jgi:hypothetical protein